METIVCVDRVWGSSGMVDEWELHCPQSEVDVDVETAAETDQLLALGSRRTERQVHHALPDPRQIRQVLLARRHLHGQALVCLRNRSGLETV